MHAVTQLGLHDLHWVFARAARTLKAYDNAGREVFACEARNRTTADGQLGHFGNCPPGEYVFGYPAPKGTAPFGPWFVPIHDAPGHDAAAAHHRAGLGWHGGGSGLQEPLRAIQSPPWIPTHGCWRSINRDLERGVALIHATLVAGGMHFVTVEAPVPGEAAEPDDWGPADAITEDE